MKIKSKFIALLLAATMVSSCNDSFLEINPVESLTEDTAFDTYDNFKTYAWSLYGVFGNNNILRHIGSNGQGSTYQGDIYSGYLTRKGTSAYNPYAFQTISEVASGNGWNFDYIRKVNIMISNIDASKMSDAQKEHWRAVGYFFRSFYYMELVARFGDVPWVDKIINDNDKEAYGARTPRKEVTDHILEDLIYAEKHIKPEGDGENTINIHAVRALMSRFTLFEGSWRKYHQLGDEGKFFDKCIESSEQLMKDFPTLHTDYGEMWTSKELSKVPGVILHKEFVDDVLSSWFTHMERTSSHAVEMPQLTVDMYLCSDGKPIATSDVYEWGKKDKSIYSVFRNRDLRLLESVAPPYRLSKNSNPNSWDYPEDAQNREYLDLMGVTKVISNPGEAGKHKVLPLMNWSASIVLKVPNIQTATNQQFLSCRGGYYFYKNYCAWEKNHNNAQTNVADKPIFKIEEVLLNYAEVKAELGLFTQEIADKTINKLRPRAQIADLEVAAIDDAFDPNRDSSVDPLLWEIRRERIIELMGEGFGFYDIRRWKKAEYFINKPHYGMWAKRSEIGKTGKIVNLETGFPDPAAEEGYIYLFDNPELSGKGWLDKYYLYMIPTNEIALNKQLLPNNPGWDIANK